MENSVSLEILCSETRMGTGAGLPSEKENIIFNTFLLDVKIVGTSSNCYQSEHSCIINHFLESFHSIIKDFFGLNIVFYSDKKWLT